MNKITPVYRNMMFIRNAFVVLLAISVSIGCSNDSVESEHASKDSVGENEECWYLAEYSFEEQLERIDMFGCKKECWYVYKYGSEERFELIKATIKRLFDKENKFKSKQEMDDYSNDKGREIFDDATTDASPLKEMIEEIKDKPLQYKHLGEMTDEQLEEHLRDAVINLDSTEKKEECLYLTKYSEEELLNLMKQLVKEEMIEMALKEFGRDVSVDECWLLSDYSFEKQLELIDWGGCEKECWYVFNYPSEERYRIVNATIERLFDKENKFNSEQEMEDYLYDKTLEMRDELDYDELIREATNLDSTEKKEECLHLTKYSEEELLNLMKQVMQEETIEEIRKQIGRD